MLLGVNILHARFIHQNFAQKYREEQFQKNILVSKTGWGEIITFRKGSTQKMRHPNFSPGVAFFNPIQQKTQLFSFAVSFLVVIVPFFFSLLNNLFIFFLSDFFCLEPFFFYGFGK